MVVDSFNYSFEKQLLSVSQWQAIISLLDIPWRDRHRMQHWHPISLSNIDYKILTKCLTERVKRVLKKLTDQSQTGFVKGRTISDGLHKILGVMDKMDMH